MTKRQTALSAIQALVDKQAEDEGLWFVAETAPEAYLQQELRRLHAEIERHTLPNKQVDEQSIDKVIARRHRH